MRLFDHILLRPVHVHVIVCTCVVVDRDHFPLKILFLPIYSDLSESDRRMFLI